MTEPAQQPSEAEQIARRSFDMAKKAKEQLKRHLLDGTRDRQRMIADIDYLWGKITDFVPRHWREE